MTPIQNPDVQELLATGWRHRIDLELDLCLPVLAQLKERLSIPSHRLADPELASLLAGNRHLAILDALVLSSSVMTALGDPGTDLLERLERAMQRGCECFYLLYEKAKILLTAGDYSQALELFFRVATLAKTNEQKLLGLENALFCMENLGISFGNTLAKVEACLELLPTGSLKMPRAQFHAFRLRSRFRNGQIREALLEDRGRKDSPLDQGRYFAFWLRQLPYHASYRPLTEDESEALCSQDTHYAFKPYRLRTLQGLCHPDDDQRIRLTESSDRFYLWVWNWLTSPELFPPHKISHLLGQIQFSRLTHKATEEDLQLIRNGLLWIGLFDPTAHRRLKALLDRVQPRQHLYPILSLESLAIQYLGSLRDGNVLSRDYARALHRHPLWNSKQLYFKALIDRVTDPQGGKAELPRPLRALSKTLAELIQTESRVTVKTLIVDLQRHELRSGPRQRTVSKPLALAFELCHRNGTVSCSEFVRSVFGLASYDPLIHNGKVFNLLARMKVLVSRTTEPSLNFRMKEGHILAEGSWRGISFIPSRQSPELPEIQAPESTALPERKRAGALPQWAGNITRGELEKLTGRPRSSTNRLISRWLERGLIARKGQARHTTYSLCRISRTNHGDAL